MSDDLFQIQSKALPATTSVVAFKGVEALSTPYAVEIDVMIPDSADVDLEGMIGERARLVATRGKGLVFNGTIASTELLNLYAGNGIYRITLRPKFWQLTLTEHSRVFVGQSIPEIIGEVLSKSGFSAGSDFELRLEGAYATLDHVCQYHESSMAFVSRWMERDGLYYFFEQGEEQEKLVITDIRVGHPEATTLPVRFLGLRGADVTAGAGLHALTCKHNQLPGSVQLTDYDYIKPGLALSGLASVVAGGPGDIVRHGDNFDSPGEGARLAKVRAEELLSRREVFSAWGTELGLHAGHTFALEEHPRAQFNQKYLLTGLEHHGNQAGNSSELAELLGLEHEEVYRVDVRAIKSGRQFRAASVTAVPRIYSVQNAVIDGPAESSYAQIDDHGRYKVKVKFDEGDLSGGKASMWVRMIQPHGGSVEGFHFPLRSGTEVLLIFLGGDPDRPMIAGVGPNAIKPSPVTMSNSSKNVIQTGGSNRFEMEDAAGGQYTTISTPTEGTFFHMGAPKDGAHLVQNTGGDNLVKIGGDRTIRVQGDRLEHVVGDLTERVVGDKLVQITGDVERKYLATFKHTVDADVEKYFNSNEFKKVLGDQTKEVTGNVLEKIEGTGEHEYTGEWKLTVHSDAKKHIDGKLTIECDAETEITSCGEIKIESTAANIEIKAATDITLVAPAGVYMETGPYLEIKATENLLVKGEMTETVIGARADTTIGAKVEVTLGAMCELFAGFKFSAEAGAAAEFGTLKALNHSLRMKECAIEQVMTAMEEHIAGLVNKSHGMYSEEDGLKDLEAGLYTVI